MDKGRYRVTPAGRAAWEKQDAAVPSDYRTLLWMIDFHGSAHTETFASHSPGRNLAECLAEMVQLGLVEAMAAGAEPAPPPADVLAIDQSELPVVSEALATHGAYVAKDRLERRAPSPKRPRDVDLLIVEDDPDQLALADLRASLAGYKVRTAASQARMLGSIADHGQPDLLLLDAVLPDGHGFRILQNLRRLPTFAALPVVLLTAKTSPADVLEGLRLGADGYITKPYSKTILASVVAEVLRLQEAR